MRLKNNIKKGIAVILLLTSILSITPQKVLHNLVVSHVDKEQCFVHKDLPIDQIESFGIVCSYEHNVNTIPYLFYDLRIDFSKLTFKISKNHFFNDLVENIFILYSDTRGSPISL